jgi:hypothetical protein
MVLAAAVPAWLAPIRTILFMLVSSNCNFNGIYAEKQSGAIRANRAGRQNLYSALKKAPFTITIKP